MTTPPARLPVPSDASDQAPASDQASADRYARYRFSLDSGTGASQTVFRWLPMATLWATEDTLPEPTCHSRPGNRCADTSCHRAQPRFHHPAHA
ncbi:MULTISPECIES: hypothetical protein [unclassified Streptomyces]|uniref:hypothetical protein n=1 Tax=unclassified Streptomyces TaxID=2593676 RepID=UPI001661494C|nr:MULTISPECIES: hypothetical protein [unclassified Streptomyces]MBD0707493.1 hypothetical protein [Streptomyces sp. CBMA291]MBD0714488.1 hypothetical protein [Streptomyces sp. CBMA370]